MTKLFGTTFRLAFGLTCIIISLLTTATFFNVLPNEHSAILHGRTVLVETIAAKSSIFITRSDIRRMEAELNLIVTRNDDIHSAAVVKKDQSILLEIGEHIGQRKETDSSKLISSNSSQLSVPILEHNSVWGEVQVNFKPLTPMSWYGVFYNPMFQLIAYTSILGFLGFYLYLGRMLKQLDPSQAIPDRVRSTLNTMAEGLLVLDAKQNIVLANEAFSNIVSIDPDQLLGKSVSQFSWSTNEEKSLNKKTMPWKTAIDNSESLTGEIIRLFVENGEEKAFMVNCSPVLNNKNKAAGVLVSFDDITALEEKEVELRKSKELADQANRAKSDFLAHMSHEIRTPMNSILGFTEVLKRGYSNNPQNNARYLNTISSSGEHLLNLINDILDLSKIEANKIELNQASCAVYTIVQDVIDIFQVKAQEKGIELLYEPDGPLPETINTDSARLRQILTNLVGNAIKFTKQGQIKIITRLDLSQKENTLYLEVHDTGIGMTQEQVSRIFNPFEQADTNTFTQFGGTGLGLSISKKFANALGGDITALSEKGKGSTFITSILIGPIQNIRLLEADEILNMAHEQVQEDNIKWAFPKSNVLIVDDGMENRELLQVVLHELGINTVSAENGKVGFDKLVNSEFDLVLMDINMPVMNGYEAVKLMRDHGYQQPIVALTANAMKGAEQKYLDAGFSDGMTKPVDINNLTQFLAQKLGAEKIKPDQVSNGSSKAKTNESNHNTGQINSIKSNLQNTNSKINGIIIEFIERMPEKLNDINDAWQQNNTQTLADLSHWLKGTAGSLGFPQLADIAHHIEDHCLTNNEKAIPEQLEKLNLACSKIEHPEAAKGENTQQVLLESHSDYEIPDVLTSQLPMDREVYRTIVQEFAVRLESELNQMESALQQEDFETLTNSAQWLIGAAGSVGFDAFTDPAKDIETQAKVFELQQISVAFEAIKSMQNRMVVPDSGSTEKPSMDTNLFSKKVG